MVFEKKWAVNKSAKTFFININVFRLIYFHYFSLPLATANSFKFFKHKIQYANNRAHTHVI